MNTISITGKGSIYVAPDVTRLETTIEQWFKTYEEAYTKARENSSWFVKILEYNHKPGKLAKTTRFDISDHIESKYDEDGDIIGHFKNGYDLTQRVKIDLPIHIVRNKTRSEKLNKLLNITLYKWRLQY